MKRISIWASKNIILSRTLLVFGYLLIMTFGVYLGSITFLEDFKFNRNLAHLVFFLLLLAIFAYPFGNWKHPFWRPTFYRKKICDWSILSCIFLLIMLNTNQFLFNWIPDVFQNAPYTLTIVETPKEGGLIKDRAHKKQLRKSRKLERKALVKKLKSQLKIWKKQRRAAKKNNTGDDLLFVLYISALIGVLILFIGLLVCALSCSGLGVAAAILGLGGLGIALILLVIGIRTKFGKD